MKVNISKEWIMENAHKEEGLSVEAGSASIGSAITLTIEEIKHLAEFAGLIVGEIEDDQNETEITITGWPEKGVKGDDGMLPPHKHIAYYDEYPEEGCVPLGSPNSE